MWTTHHTQLVLGVLNTLLRRPSRPSADEKWSSRGLPVLDLYLGVSAVGIPQHIPNEGWDCGSTGRELVYEAQAWVPPQAPHHPGMVEQPAIPALRKSKQEDQEFKVTFSYAVCLRPA